MFSSLIAQGYQIESYQHAEAILSHDLGNAASEIVECLSSFRIPVAELVAGGGGESRGTQRLRRSFADRGWPKHNFVIEKTVDGKVRESVSHEIDHVKSFPPADKTVALEIEWNNKDPFFDRDLESFKRLHADGIISVGVIITRGSSMHDAMQQMIREFAINQRISRLEQLKRHGYDPTPKQRAKIESALRKNPDFPQVWSKIFTADKFGQATTHWRKLQDRVDRGVGSPCPLLLIGLPAAIISK